MKITWKALLALFFYTLGVVGWFYVGGWMILRGVRGVILAHMAGEEAQTGANDDIKSTVLL